MVWPHRNTDFKEELHVFHGESLKHFPKLLSHISREQQNPEWWLQAVRMSEKIILSSIVLYLWVNVEMAYFEHSSEGKAAAL